MRKSLATAAVMLTAGCSMAPSINFLGAFFPSWLFCLLGGIVFTLLTRVLLIKAQLIDHVGPLLLFYPALGAIYTFLCWLIFFQA